MSTATCEPLVQEHDTAGHTGSMQLVSFKLAEETYGIEITKIREIILVGEITHIPETPPHVKGLINLRSTVIPVIDLRIRFSLADAELTPESRIMVLHVGSRMIGIVVDSVNEVLRVTQQEISPAPPTVTSSGNEYMTGLVRLKEDLLILLDVDRLFGDEETQALAAAAVGGKIYAFGGDLPGSKKDQNEEYDPGVSSTFTALSPNTLYTFKAQSRNSSGWVSGESVDVSTYTLAVASSPIAPTTSSIGTCGSTRCW